MNKAIITLILMMIMEMSCHLPNKVHTSQESNFKGKYSIFLKEGEKEITTYYHTMLSKSQDGSYIFRQFFPETMTLTELTTYSSDRNTKNGYYASYSDEGELKSEGKFINNKEEGIWNSKYFGIGNYSNGKKQGEFVVKSKDDKVIAKYNYVNDLKDGDFVMYDTLGNVENKGIYKADTIFQQLKLKKVKSQVEIMPIFQADCKEENLEAQIKCAQTKMLEHIYKSLRYPADARKFGVEGNAIVQFVVEKDGSIVDISVIKGLCQSIKNELIRVVKTFPKWQPGYQEGKPVRVLYTIPVRFKLEN